MITIKEISIFLITLSLTYADSISFYLGEACHGENLGGANDIGNTCISVPVNTQSYILTPDDGFAYFAYNDGDCFQFDRNLPLGGCMSLDGAQGFNRRPINGEATLSRIEARIARMNNTKVNIENAPLIRTKQNLAKRNPGDYIRLNDANGQTDYAALEGDESGATRRITAGEAATLADDAEANWRTDLTEVDGQFRDTNNQGTITFQFDQGTVGTYFNQDFFGRIVDQILSFIRAGNDREMYNFDIGNLDDRRFTQFGRAIYQVREGSGLKFVDTNE